MNAIKSFIVAAAVLAVGSAIPTTQAAKPDFSILAGQYKASYQLVTGTTTLSSSNLAVTITVPKNGSKATIQIVGFATATTGSTPLTVAMLGNLKVSQQKVAADNALIAFYVQLPATALASSSRNRVRFTLVNSSPALGSTVTMNYTLSFSKKRFSISGNGTLGTTPTSVVMKAKKQGK